ncbi:hypothetical protein K6L59_02780, partial [Candidatus Phytoplasma sp. Tabriz.2]|nr:hypothetical protein [Candidatus Phytoplasma australiense]
MLSHTFSNSLSLLLIYIYIYIYIVFRAIVHQIIAGISVNSQHHFNALIFLLWQMKEEEKEKIY